MKFKSKPKLKRKSKRKPFFNIKVDHYFDHPYNTTIKNERAIEIVLGLRYLYFVDIYDLVEIGAVMPYYSSTHHMCIDPVDLKASVQGYAENYDYGGKHVLSISTIEHVGSGDYNLEKKEVDLGFNILNKVYEESKSCLISWPMGYNKYLDEITKTNINKFNYFFYVRTDRVKRPDSSSPSWEWVDNEEGFGFNYPSHRLGATSVIFIHKGLI